MVGKIPAVGRQSVANLNREIVPEAVVTLRESLRDAGLSEDVAVELEMHIKESVHLQRCELLDGYLRWRMAFEIERGVDESLMVDTLSRARDACLTVYPQAAAIWIKTPSTDLSISEAHVSLLGEGEHGRLAAEYLQLLLASNRRDATRLILERVEAGLSIEHLYLNVFQPALMEIGRLWQINALAIGQEHFCTAVTQAVMAQLYPRIFSHDPIGRLIVATTVSGEFHEIGIRMVADFFELHGWDTYYMSSDCPSEAIIDVLHRQHPDVLAIGVTTLRHVEKARQLIGRVRETPEVRDTLVLTGGHIFGRMPELWQEIGADGWAPDAVNAVSVANQLTGARS